MESADAGKGGRSKIVENSCEAGTSRGSERGGEISLAKCLRCKRERTCLSLERFRRGEIHPIQTTFFLFSTSIFHSKIEPNRHLGEKSEKGGGSEALRLKWGG